MGMKECGDLFTHLIIFLTVLIAHPLSFRHLPTTTHLIWPGLSQFSLGVAKVSQKFPEVLQCIPVFLPLAPPLIS